MKSEIFSLTKKFVQIPSVPGDKKALSKILFLALSELRGFTIERFIKNGVESALVYATPSRPKKFKVLLNAHLDIIPAKKNQYRAVVKGQRLYGAGSMDMKAGAAALITVFREVARNVEYPLGLQLVTDEEVGGFYGTKHQIEKGVRANFVIAGEPTNFDIVDKAKGVLWLKVFLKGKTAHSAYPWRGESAVREGVQFVQKLEKMFPTPEKETWATTVNVSRIETTNLAFNKIPDDCTLGLDIRFVEPRSEMVIRSIKKILPKGATYEIVAEEPPLRNRAGDPYILQLKNTAKNILKREAILRGANGSSDARHFIPLGSAGVEFGPIGGGIGSDEEWVDIPSLERYADVLRVFLKTF